MCMMIVLVHGFILNMQLVISYHMATGVLANLSHEGDKLAKRSLKLSGEK